MSRRALPVVFLSMLILTAAAAETITFSADSMTGNASQNAGSTTLGGNAHITTGTMEIRADRIELSGDEYRFITAEGNVRGTNKESALDFSCDRMTYDRTTKLAVLEGTVALDDSENEVTANAQRIEYDDVSHVAVMQIDVTLRQKDSTCTASYAIYRKDDQFLTLEGNPQVVQGSDTFRAQQITLNMDTQEITLDGRVRGSVTVQQDEQEEE